MRIKICLIPLCLLLVLCAFHGCKRPPASSAPPELYDCTPPPEIVQNLGEMSGPCAADPLIQALTDQNMDIRAAAAHGLGREDGDPRAYEPLCQALKNDPGTRVRLEALRALFMVAGESAAHVLASGAGDRDEKIREEACRALGLLGSENAHETLLRCMKDKSPGVRHGAAAALAWLGETEPVKNALGDKSPWVRQQAAESLGNLLALEAVHELIKATGDEDENVRASALHSLGKIRTPETLSALIRIIQEGEPRDQDRAVNALQAYDEPWAVAPIFDAMLDQEAHAPEMAEALSDIIGKDYLEKTLPLLDLKSASLRVSGCRLLGKTGDPGAVPVLIKALKDPSWEVQVSAALALGELGDKRAVKPLMSLVDSDVAEHAMQALAKIKDPGAAQPIIKRIKANDSEVASWAMIALGELESKQAIKPLLSVLALGSQECLEHYDDYVYDEAILALGKIGKESMIELFSDIVRECLEHAAMGHEEADEEEHEALQIKASAAARALGDMGGPEAEAILMQAASSCHCASFHAKLALGKLKSSKARNLLLEALHPAPESRGAQSSCEDALENRIAAALALALLGEKNAGSMLLEAMELDPNDDIAFAMIMEEPHVAELIQPSRIMDDLALILSKDSSWQKRRLAALALGRIHDERFLKPLIQALEDKHWQVRNAALTSLEEITSINLGLKREKWEAWLESRDSST